MELYYITAFVKKDQPELVPLVGLTNIELRWPCRAVPCRALPCDASLGPQRVFILPDLFTMTLYLKQRYRLVRGATSAGGAILFHGSCRDETP